MDRDRKLFFVHLMKTGGAAFRAALRTVLPAEAIYPHDGLDDLPGANQEIGRLLALGADERRTYRAYAGHFPFFASRLLADEVWTATIVRDPVDRTISFLKQCRSQLPECAGATLEEIYDDPMRNAMLIADYQTKMFSMRESDGVTSQLDRLDVDDARFAEACANLATVDIVGLKEDYERFVEAIERRTGWTFGRVGRWRPSDPDPVTPAFRDRIAEENAHDVRFHRFAQTLHRQRPLDR